jgi:hypothetical protein
MSVLPNFGFTDRNVLAIKTGHALSLWQKYNSLPKTTLKHFYTEALINRLLVNAVFTVEISIHRLGKPAVHHVVVLENP